MIRDARVLQPEFVPGDIVHRTSEVNGLSAALNPVTRGEQGEITPFTDRSAWAKPASPATSATLRLMSWRKSSLLNASGAFIPD